MLYGGLLTVQAESGLVELGPFTVYAGSQLTEQSPALQLSERMQREARVDLQRRGGERYQTDISVRGGIFEGTGLMVGGITLFDPQTGHYFSEIPLDPAFFISASLLTGVDNGMGGFNSTAGSVDWQWAPLDAGGEGYLVIGSDAHLGGGLRQAGTKDGLGYEVAVMTEQGDGSVANGDFDMTRISGRIEQRLGAGTLRIFGGYVDKFYGWPNMYSGGVYGDVNETDDYAVSLLGWQWEQDGKNPGSRHRMGGYWRQVDDDYEFSRETPNAWFEHKTEVYSLQGDGEVTLKAVDVLYNWAWVTDRIIRSTSLVHGDFTKRDYGKAALLLRHTEQTAWGDWSIYGGSGLDTSNQDSTVGTPQAGFSASGISDGSSWRGYVEYSRTSQVPGYTALNSRSTGGLFRGNKDLGREKAETVEAGFAMQRENFSGKLVVFHRKDTDLVDWVYESASAGTARSAAPVDMDVSGVEGWLRWELDATALELGYAWLDKDADYRSTVVDASFYALNHARHRLLLSLERRFSEKVSGRVGMEYREHPGNSLRSGPDDALYLNVEAVWKDCFGAGWTLTLRGENLTRETFQPIPGTPGPGREGSLILARAW
jgi:outer membrane cobalamin receptor